MKTYTEEFKKTIVELYEMGNKTKSDLAREYGTSEGNVRSWIKKYGKIQTSTGEVTNNDEITKLKKKIHEIEMENEILKRKSKHIFKTIEDKVKFIDKMKDKFNTRMLCKVTGLHHSVYYYHKKKQSK